MANALKTGGKRVASMLESVEHSSANLDRRLDELRLRRRLISLKRKRRWMLIATLTVISTIVVCVMFVRSGNHQLHFAIDGAHGEAGAWVSAGGVDVPITFSDGSRIDLKPLGHARVESIDTRGARILLERGSLSASIVHNQDSAWTVAAGPFEVHVIGTRFDATWDPTLEVLKILLAEGRVEVTASCLRDPRSVSTGETVRLSCRDVLAQEHHPDSSSVARTPPDALPTLSDAGGIDDSATQAESAHESPLNHSDEARSWRALAQSGDFPGAFAAADRQGIDALIANASSSDLSVLSDVARLAKRPDVARRIASSLRERFPGSDAAANAAFQLGRMSQGSTTEAQKWFQIYLTERPSGPFEPEALGRLLELQNLSGRTEASKATAATYLAKHPDGAHAPLARSILEP